MPNFLLKEEMIMTPSDSMQHFTCIFYSWINATDNTSVSSTLQANEGLQL